MPSTPPNAWPCRALLSPVVVALALLAAGDARAEAPAASAAEFLARVRATHPGLELLEARLAEAAAEVTAAGIWDNPALAYDREEVFADGRGQPENFLRLSLPLQISGRRGLRVEGAERGREAAAATARREQGELLAGALRLYWEAAGARARRDALRGERDELARLVEAVRARAAAGDAAGQDVDRLELEQETLEDLLADAERELAAARRAVAVLAGEPTGALDASEPLALPPAPGELPAAGEAAVEARPDLRAARARVSQAERELAAARRGWVPGLTLSGGAKSAQSGEGTAWGYLAGVAVSVPLFDRGQGEAALAEARLRAVRAELALLERQVRAEAEGTRDALVRSLAQAQRLEQRQLPRLERLLRGAEAAYREGQQPVFELLDAYRAGRGVRLRWTELRLQARLRQIDFDLATGQVPGGTP